MNRRQLFTEPYGALSSASYSQNSTPAVFQSIEAAQDIKLVTDPSSRFWHEIVPVYAEVDANGGLVSSHRTEVRSRWTKDNLYVIFVCPYEELYLKPDPNTILETTQLWQWDVADLFIGSDFHDIRRYREFEVSPQAEWIDLDINLHLSHHEDGWMWNSGFEVAARIDAENRVWYGAMGIPFPALDKRSPAVGTRFRANLFRSQGPPNRDDLLRGSPR